MTNFNCCTGAQLLFDTHSYQENVDLYKLYIRPSPPYRHAVYTNRLDNDFGDCEVRLQGYTMFPLCQFIFVKWCKVPKDNNNLCITCRGFCNVFACLPQDMNSDGWNRLSKLGSLPHYREAGIHTSDSNRHMYWTTACFCIKIYIWEITLSALVNLSKWQWAWVSHFPPKIEPCTSSSYAYFKYIYKMRCLYSSIATASCLFLIVGHRYNLT